MGIGDHVHAVSAAERCAEDARRASHAAGVEIRLLDEAAELAAAAALFATVWRGQGESVMPAELARAMSYSRNYVAGAFADDRLVGAIVGFLARTWAPEQELHLHSHVAAVLAEMQRRDIGFALKLHQLVWATDEGLPFVQWTFDPLLRSNAWFNLSKLAAAPVRYHRNFYGHRNDGVNDGSDTDRLVVRWSVATRAGAADAPARAPLEDDALRQDGAQALISEDADGTPRTTLPASAGGTLLVPLPADVLGLRREQPQLACSWRAATREALEWGFAQGLSPRHVTRQGSYVLLPARGEAHAP